MSLLDEAMTECCIMSKAIQPDGQGGTQTTWTAGDTFLAAIVKNASKTVTAAQKQEPAENYTITVARNISIHFYDVIKRISDSRCFRVVSRDDSYTPQSASLNMRQVEAEEWTMPV